MSEAPAELWARPSLMSGRYYTTRCTDEPDAVRYVRADLYEALLGRMAVVRSWNEAPCLEPLRAALEASEDNDASGAEQILRTAIKRVEAPCLEPLPPDAGAHEQQPGAAMLAALRALKEAS